MHRAGVLVAKPKKEQTSTPDLTHYEELPVAQENYTDRLIASLPKELGLDDTREAARFKRIIRRWAGLNWTILQDEIRAPSAKQTQRELQEFLTTAESLRGGLQNISTDAAMFLWRAATNFYAPQSGEPNTVDWRLGNYRVNRVEDELGLLRAYLQGAIGELEPEKTGPQAKKRRAAVRREAVRELACIWKEFTGDRPRRRIYKQDHPEKPGQPYGPFYEYVVTLLDPIFGVEAQSGIDNEIKNVCAGMEKSPEKYPIGLFQTT